MNEIAIFASLAITLIVTTSGPSVYGASPGQGLRLHCVLGEDSIQPFEPVSVLITLRNEASEVVSHTSTWQFSTFIREGDNGEWRGYGRPGPTAAPPPPTSLDFTPGEAIGEAVVLDVKENGRHVFGKPGIYWVKARFYDLNMESEPVRLEVKEPPADETNAVGYISEHQLFRYFAERNAIFFTHCFDERQHASQRELERRKVEWDALNIVGADPQEELRLFVERFPNSRYTQWAKLGALFVKKGRAGLDFAVLGAVEKEMEQLAPTLPEPMRSSCWHSAGMAAKLRGDTSTAQADFDHALATVPETVMRFQINRAKKELNSRGASWDELRRLSPGELNLR